MNETKTSDFWKWKITKRPSLELIETKFTWKGTADSVFLLGSFDDWKSEIRMEPGINEYTKTLYIPENKYEYKFIVNGYWQHDPSNTAIPDNHGGFNNVILTKEEIFKSSLPDVWNQLKKLSIPKFSGDVRQYEEWKTKFNTCIDKSEVADQLKLLYLHESLSGEALNVIDGLGHSESAYAVAKERIERKYGGYKRNITLILEELERFKPLRQKRAKDIEKLAYFIDNLVMKLNVLDKRSELGCGYLYLKLQQKLTISMLKNYHQWIHEHHIVESVLALRDWIIKESEYWQIAFETKYGISTNDKESKNSDQCNGKASSCNDDVKQIKFLKANTYPEWNYANKRKWSFRCQKQCHPTSESECRETRMNCGCKRRDDLSYPIETDRHKEFTAKLPERKAIHSKKRTVLPKNSPGMLGNPTRGIDRIKNINKTGKNTNRNVTVEEAGKKFRTYQVGIPWKNKAILYRNIDTNRQSMESDAKKVIQNGRDHSVTANNSLFPRKAEAVDNTSVNDNLKQYKQAMLTGDIGSYVNKECDVTKLLKLERQMDKSNKNVSTETDAMEDSIIDADISRETLMINISGNPSLEIKCDNRKENNLIVLQEILLNNYRKSNSTSNRNCKKPITEVILIDKVKVKWNNSVQKKSIDNGMSDTFTGEDTYMTKFKEIAKKLTEKKTAVSISSRNGIIIDEDLKNFRKAMVSNDANCSRTINNTCQDELERLNVKFESSLWFTQIVKLMLFTWLKKIGNNQGIMNKRERLKINAIQNENGLNLPIHEKVIKKAEKKNSTTDEEKDKLNNEKSDKEYRKVLQTNNVKQRSRGNKSNVLERQNRFTDTNSTLWFYQIVKLCKVLPRFDSDGSVKNISKKHEQDKLALDARIEIRNDKTSKSFTQTKMVKDEEKNLTETEAFDNLIVNTIIYEYTLIKQLMDEVGNRDTEESTVLFGGENGCINGEVIMKNFKQTMLANDTRYSITNISDHLGQLFNEPESWFTQITKLIVFSWMYMEESNENIVTNHMLSILKTRRQNRDKNSNDIDTHKSFIDKRKNILWFIQIGKSCLVLLQMNTDIMKKHQQDILVIVVRIEIRCSKALKIFVQLEMMKIKNLFYINRSGLSRVF